MIYDFIIIGGGMAGISLSYFLSKIDCHKKILLLEKKKILQSGAVCASQGSLALLSEQQYFRNRTQEIMREIQIKENIDFENNGSINISFSLFETIVQIFVYILYKLFFNNNFKFMFGNQIRKKDKSLSPKIYSVLYSEKSSSCNPIKLMKYLKNESVKNGVKIYENINIINIESIIKPTSNQNSINNYLDKNNGYKVYLENMCNVVEGKRLIITCGAWVNEVTKFLDLKLNIIPIKGQNHISKPIEFVHEPKMITFDILSNIKTFIDRLNPKKENLPNGYSHNKNGKKLVFKYYGKYDKYSKCFWFGTMRKPSDLNDYSIDLEALRDAIDYTEKIYNLPKNTIVIDRIMTSFMPFTIDNKLLIKQINQNLWIYNGLSQSGVARGLAISEKLAYWIINNKKPIVFK